MRASYDVFAKKYHVVVPSGAWIHAASLSGLPAIGASSFVPETVVSAEVTVKSSLNCVTSPTAVIGKPDWVSGGRI